MHWVDPSLYPSVFNDNRVERGALVLAPALDPQCSGRVLRVANWSPLATLAFNPGLWVLRWLTDGCVSLGSLLPQRC